MTLLSTLMARDLGVDGLIFINRHGAYILITICGISEVRISFPDWRQLILENIIYRKRFICKGISGVLPGCRN